jgi:archaemetzincin
VWIGFEPVEAGALHELRDHLVRAFGVPTHVAHESERPVEAFDARRGQHSSTRILQWLAQRHDSRAQKLLGLTDVDLFIPILTFVYGEAQLDGRAAVVSKARLGEPGRGGWDPLLVGRLKKEATHELGHTFGLLHCDEPGCVMSRSTNLREVDAKGGGLCHDCVIHLREARAREEAAS